MKNKVVFIIFALLPISVIPLFAQRTITNINSDWQFRFSYQVLKNSSRRVDIPHTWNALDALSGKYDYKRGIGNYTKQIFIPGDLKGKRLFIRFKGANTITDVFINGCYAGEHKGGYGAFIFEITDNIIYGKENTILVRVNNGEQLDIMPLVGDFNFYGGIYRDVELITTNKVCISPLDYASSGVHLSPTSVSRQQASITGAICLSNSCQDEQNVTVQLQILDNRNIIKECRENLTLPGNTESKVVKIPVTINNPHLWNGTQDPFMYQAKIILWKDKEKVDEVTQPLGLRYFKIDPNEGFFLNGRHITLHGVNRHQDRPDIGNALHSFHHEEDLAIIKEMGANAIRLSHYPQSEYFLDLLDKAGIIAWSEIPFVGPGGYGDKGFVDKQSFRDNGNQQLKEMIRQQYNHPSICFWGIFNELKEEGDNPTEYIRELNETAHLEDPYRLTTCASNQDGQINFITDVGAWNKYDGWYGSSPSTLASFLDQTHQDFPNRCIGISEYGAGASIYHQQDSIKQPDPSSWWHPENWQVYYHIKNWEIISSRPYVWGTFIWNMFDFGAAHRREGDRPGINDKGLVTFDRKIKKDAFYFYKANWNPEPMLYISGKRYNMATNNKKEIIIFSNCKCIDLYSNDIFIKSIRPDKYHISSIIVPLSKGRNSIMVKTKAKKKILTDKFDVFYNE